MIRDARMQALVSGAKEPITPFIQRVRCLFEHNGVSSILVIGGAGDYFDVADLVIMMDCYAAFDRTNEAKRIATHFSSISQTTVCAIPSSPLPSDLLVRARSPPGRRAACGPRTAESRSCPRPPSRPCASPLSRSAPPFLSRWAGPSASATATSHLYG